MYLVDNNVLSHLSPPQRASRFFHDHCRVPREVIYEAGGLAKAKLPKDVEYPTTEQVLSILCEVMATVSTNDTTLVNLYANKGNADPMLIACALDAIRSEARLLFGPTWVIVSNDNAVRMKAQEFSVETRTREEFMNETRINWER